MITDVPCADRDEANQNSADRGRPVARRGLDLRRAYLRAHLFKRIGGRKWRRVCVEPVCFRFDIETEFRAANSALNHITRIESDRAEDPMFVDERSVAA